MSERNGNGHGVNGSAHDGGNGRISPQLFICEPPAVNGTVQFLLLGKPGKGEELKQWLKDVPVEVRLAPEHLTFGHAEQDVQHITVEYDPEGRAAFPREKNEVAQQIIRAFTKSQVSNLDPGEIRAAFNSVGNRPLPESQGAMTEAEVRRREAERTIDNFLRRL